MIRNVTGRLSKLNEFNRELTKEKKSNRVCNSFELQGSHKSFNRLLLITDFDSLEIVRCFFFDFPSENT